jgi:hypothetical protein
VLPSSARAAVIVLSMAFLGTGSTVPAADDSWDGVSRVVAVGDVHGDLDQLVAVLQNAGVIDANQRWSGGRTHLVQTGDRVDRGPTSRKVMDLLMRLEKEAKKAGGRVHPLIGNHEAMNVLGDLRYVIPEEFAEFQDKDSARRRDAGWERVKQAKKEKGEPAPTDEDRKRFDAEHPLGWIEHRYAWSPGGAYHEWISKQNAVIRVGDSLFLHGGISPKYADFALDALNGPIQRELKEAAPMSAILAPDPEGPLWYRGLARDDPSLGPHVEAVLKKHGVRRIVIGHTPTEGLVFPRFGGRVVQIDVGLAKAYGGPPACLVLEDGKAFAMHRGKKLPLPGEGEALVAYAREVAALEPGSEKLQALPKLLEAALVPAAPARD